MDNAGAPDSNDTPTTEVPLAPPSPLAAPMDATEPLAVTEQLDATQPMAVVHDMIPMAAPAMTPPQTSSVVLGAGATPPRRKPWLAVLAGLAILGVGAFAVVGWMGKADADDKAAASEKTASSLAQEAEGLRGELEAANQAAEETDQQLTEANSEISVLEQQVGDLEAAATELEAEIETLQDEQGNSSNGASSLNDLVLTDSEYRLIESSFDIAPPPIETARQLGAEMCAAPDIAAVVDIVFDYQSEFPADASNDDVAVVSGAIAGVMCQDHLLQLAG